MIIMNMIIVIVPAVKTEDTMRRMFGSGSSGLGIAICNESVNTSN